MDQPINTKEREKAFIKIVFACLFFIIMVSYQVFITTKVVRIESENSIPCSNK